MPPEDVGMKIASVLLEEIGQGGVVDSNHQFIFEASYGHTIRQQMEIYALEQKRTRQLLLVSSFCIMSTRCSKVRVGKLSLYGIETFRNINDFLTPCTSTSTVILKCAGCGLNNLCRKIS
ncbi:hypothetical protein DVH24_005839 [Malus domestica]|uniref:Uncharacterized protein n=1 Tax=Malus domestica TaxID=3750 RepID=A0A498IJQ0_MALDO|nr:hypothetical protein DVH24_005839 [Malus domestica]